MTANMENLNLKRNRRNYFEINYTEILAKPLPLGSGQLLSAIVRISVSKSFKQTPP